MVRCIDSRSVSLNAFINACSHRARAVTQSHEERGQCKGFVCPYHAWRYGTDAERKSLETVARPLASMD